MLLDLVIYSSDISNLTKPYEIYDIWAHKVMTEFYQQGDKEKVLGLPVSFLCVRETSTVAQGQFGFIDGVVLLFFIYFIEMFPNLQFLVDNIKEKKTKEDIKKMKEKKKQKRNKHS